MAKEHFHTLTIRVAGVDRDKLRRKKTNTIAAALVALAIGAVVTEMDREQVQARVGVTGLAITPATVQFAAQEIDTNSSPQLVTFQNPGSAPVEIGSLTLSNPANFSLDLRDCPDGRVAPLKTCAAIVVFHPSREGVVNGSLERVTTLQRVNLEGSGFARPVPPSVPPPAPPPTPEPPPPPTPPNSTTVNSSTATSAGAKTGGRFESRSVSVSGSGD
jgi:hypothetical protein